ncbi:MAG TPA: hypothetical protein EYP22_02370 [Methanosarcinales archaeon]|nr:hypothetical protein [Methanosarcinales archaeon]
MGAKDNESVLIITDTLTPQRITDVLFKESHNIGCETMLMKILPRATHGKEPPKAVAEAMKNVDIIIAPTSKSLTHTQARIDAKAAGARMASMPGITEEMMTKGGMTADYNYISKVADDILSRLEGSKEVKIITELGTNLTFDVSGCKWHADTGICHKAGDMTNLPAGEVYIAPKNTNGILVVDGAMGGVGILEKPIEIKIVDNYAIEINSKKLSNMVDSVGKLGRNIAEFGIGINNKAKLIGNVLEDEKVKGTVHVALGDNSTIGGNVKVDLHLDGIITLPKMFVDGEEFLIERF